MNFSNNDTRAKETGWEAIKKQIAKLEKRHAVHIAAYGEGNERRLTGMQHYQLVLFCATSPCDIHGKQTDQACS